MMSLCDQTEAVDPRYIAGGSFKGFAYKRIPFALAAIRKGVSSGTIVISHINLLPVAFFIKLLAPKSRVILIAHGKEVWSVLKEWQERFIRTKVEVWAVSNFTKAKMVANYGLNEDKIQVLNNCLDPYFKLPVVFDKPAYLLERYVGELRTPIIFTMSRMDIHERNKGYDQVLDCLCSLSIDFPDLKYIIAGKITEPERKRILKKVKDLKVEKRVILPGFISAEELTDHYLLCDVFIMPSTKEGFGLVFLEALACGRPVIAGNKDGSVDALRNGELGALVDPAATQEIQYALLSALQKPRNQHAQALQALTFKHFHFEQYKLQVNTLLQSALKPNTHQIQILLFLLSIHLIMN